MPPSSYEDFRGYAFFQKLTLSEVNPYLYLDFRSYKFFQKASISEKSFFSTSAVRTPPCCEISHR